MSDPKEPEEDATIIVTGREPTKDGSDGKRQEAEEDPNLRTIVGTPPPSGASPGATTGKAPGKPAAPPRAPEENLNFEPATETMMKPPPPTPPRQQYVAPKKKGGGAGLFLFILLLLAIGGGAYLFMGQSGGGSDWTQWLPFKLGSDKPQVPARNVPAAGQATAPEPTAKHQWVQAGMPIQVVRDLLGEPLRVGTVDQMQQWEYDTGTELIIVRFQGDKVFDKSTAPYPSTGGGQIAGTPSTGTSVSNTQAPQTTQAPLVSTSPGTTAATETVQTTPQQTAGAPRYDQIQVGMTPDAVSRILGEPSDVKQVAQAVVWEYDTGKELFVVRFQRDKVASRGLTAYRAPKPADAAVPAAASTAAPPATAQIPAASSAGAPPAPSDYDKIKVGMTPDAVTQILGKPKLVKKLRSSTEWEYETPQGIFEVRFRNNKVSFKGMEAPAVKKGTPAAPAPSAQ